MRSLLRNRCDLTLDDGRDFGGFRVFGHIRCDAVLALETFEPLLLGADIAMLHGDLVGGLAVKSLFCILDAFQKLCVEVGCRRNGRIVITHKAGGTDIQRDRNSCRTDSRVALGVVTEHRHFCRTDMKLRRQVQGCSLCAENNGIHLITLRELHHFVKALPVAVKCEFELHVLDLVVCEDLTFHDFNALVLYKEFPHYSSPTFHSLFSRLYSIYPSRHCTLSSPCGSS